MNQLVTKQFEKQCLAFPDRVDRALAEITTVTGRKELLDQSAAMQHYAQRIKAGIKLERPIAIGVLKLKAGLGELMPPEKGGRGKLGKAVADFSTTSITAFRKLHKYRDQFEDYCDSLPEDKPPTQEGFLSFVNGAHVSQNSGVSEWYTPPEYIEAAVKVLGIIDLDPASSKVAQKTVKAEKWYSVDDDGLSKHWVGNVWMNPPYTASLVGKFTDKLCEHVASGDVKSAVCLTNNSTDTGWWQRMVSASAVACFPSGRIRFCDIDGNPAGAPLQGQAICYLGKSPARFIKHFEGFGACLRK